MSETVPESSLYETPDSPDPTIKDVNNPPPDYDSEYFSHTSLDPESARNKFSRSTVHGEAPDFTDLKTRGWRVAATSESRAEKIARIQRELQELESAESNDETVKSMLGALESVSLSSDKVRQSSGPGKVASQISLESIEKMSLLEGRLATLESRIGSSSRVSLASEIETMRVKVALLTKDSTAIDRALPRLQALLEQAEELKRSDLYDRILALHESSSSIAEATQSMPLVLERLQSLRKIHENAAESNAKMEAIRDALATRAHDIREWRATLDVTKEQIKAGEDAHHENLACVRSLHDSLCRRIDKIGSD